MQHNLRSSPWKWEIKISNELKTYYQTRVMSCRCECPDFDEKKFIWQSLPPHICEQLTSYYKGISEEDHFWWNDDPEQTPWTTKGGSGGVWFDVAPWTPDGTWYKQYIQDKKTRPDSTKEWEVFLHSWGCDPLVKSVVRVTK